MTRRAKIILAVALVAAIVLAVWAEGDYSFDKSRLAPTLRTLLTVGAKLTITLLLAIAIGTERETRDKPAGVRTISMVGVGACLFTILGLRITGGDGESIARVIQGIVTGVGFLGAGTIIKHEFQVEGLTTAATLWAVAAVGLACGLGYYPAAVIGTGAILVVLTVLRGFDRRLRHDPHYTTHPDGDERDHAD